MRCVSDELVESWRFPDGPDNIPRRHYQFDGFVDVFRFRIIRDVFVGRKEVGESAVAVDPSWLATGGMVLCNHDTITQLELRRGCLRALIVVRLGGAAMGTGV